MTTNLKIYLCLTALMLIWIVAWFVVGLEF